MTIIPLVMSRKEPYELVYDPLVKEHLRAIVSKHHSLILDSIEEQLLFEPEVETRNRKPLQQLQQPFLLGARWELRLGPGNRFRVYYKIESEERQVKVLAVGVKVRNRVFIGGEELNP